jgi:ABC-type amino acid transport substrate-binding protein
MPSNHPRQTPQMRGLRAIVPAWSPPLVALAALLLAAFASWSAAAQAPSSQSPPLKVAVYMVAPYASVGANGELTGHSVRFWSLVAAELGRSSKLIPVESMESVLGGLNAGTYDLAIGAITVTPAREAVVDFTQPTHPSGVAVAVRRTSGLTSELEALWSTVVELLPMFILVAALVVVAGYLAWRLERRTSSDGAPERTDIASLGDGVYWAAVTMTTVGYGDKTPKSAVARILTIVWMFIALIVISVYSGTVTAKITTAQIVNAAGAESGLRLRRLGAVRASSGAEFLTARGVSFTPYASLPEALAALADDRIDAVFNSRGALVHHVARANADLEVLSGDLTNGWMAIAVPNGSERQEALNVAILKVLASQAWLAEREQMAQEYAIQGKADRTTF